MSYDWEDILLVMKCGEADFPLFNFSFVALSEPHNIFALDEYPAGLQKRIYSNNTGYRTVSLRKMENITGPQSLTYIRLITYDTPKVINNTTLTMKLQSGTEGFAPLDLIIEDVKNLPPSFLCLWASHVRRVGTWLHIILLYQ